MENSQEFREILEHLEFAPHSLVVVEYVDNNYKNT